MVKDIFEVSVNILEMFIVLNFISRYLGYRFTGLKRYIGFGVAWVAAVFALTTMNYHFVYEGLIGLILVAIYFSYAVICLEGNIFFKLFIAGFIHCVVYLIALCTVLVISIVGQYSFQTLFGTLDIGRILWVSISKIILVIICEILLKYRFDNYIKSKDMALLLITPIIALASISIMMNVVLQNSGLRYQMLMASASVISANILTYYVFIKISRDSKFKMEYELLKQSYDSDKRNLSDIEDLYNSACGIRHDLEHHLMSISTLIDTDTREAKEYIAQILGKELSPVYGFVNTNNSTFNAITNAKMAVCRKYGIDTQIRVMNHCLDDLQHDEIGILFGNLFDNAIEAARKSTEKCIELEIQRQGAYLSIFMSNSISESVMSGNKELHTTKVDAGNHGYGTKNIRRIVDEHDGIIRFFEENHTFCCDILI